MDTDRASTLLPTPPKTRRPPVDWGKRVAMVVCVLLAIVGALPIAAAFLVRSSALEGWAAQKTRTLIAAYGIDAQYDLDVHLWPLSVELDHVTVAASDGGSPVFAAKSLRARPKPFPLLAGKLVIDQIEADTPSVRVVVKDGQLANLALHLPPKDPNAPPSGPFRAPFRVVSISDGLIDATIDRVHAQLTELDLDVTAEDAEALATSPIASSFEIAIHAGRSSLETPGLQTHDDDGKPNPPPDPNEDLLCSLDGRVRLEPDRVLVRHLEAQGMADIGGSAAPNCDAPANDPARVEVALSHVRAQIRTNEHPDVDGHVKVRAPLAIAARFIDLPPTSGWVGAEVDLRYAEDTKIPEVGGHLEAHAVAVGKYSVVEEVSSEITVKSGIVKSPLTTINLADGTVSLADLTIDLATMALMHVRLDAHDVSFTTLMKEMGVAAHSHVQWNIREVHVPEIKGTLVPLKLDGDVSAHTTDFAVFDRWALETGRQRVIGVTDAQIQMKLAVRPTGLQFHQAHVVTPRSVLDASIISLGFDEVLLVELPKASIDLADITPLSTTAIGGHTNIGVKMWGNFSKPELSGSGSIDNFSLGSIPFGNVTEVQAQLEDIKTLRLTGVKAQKNKSIYEMPTARLAFGGRAGLEMDADAKADSLGLRDFLALWHLEDDPRFTSFDADIKTDARIHLALGGPEDVCGGGYVDVRAGIHAKTVKLYGETFADGDADLEYRSTDGQGGMQGVDVDVRAMSLHRLHTPGQEPIGQLLGAASIHRGGILRGTISVDGLPLSRIAMLGSLSGQVEGAVSGVVNINGTIDAPGAQADLDLTPLRVRGAPLGSSHLHVAMAKHSTPDKPIGHTKCGAPITKPFDKNAPDDPLRGEVVVDGTMFGDQVTVTHLALLKEATTDLTGAVTFRKLDLGAALQASTATPGSANAARGGGDNAKAGGHLSGQLVVEKLTFEEPDKTRARFTPTELSLDAAGGTLALRKNPVLLAVDGDRLTVPPMTFDLAAAGGFNGSFTLKGQVAKLTHGGDLGLSAEIAPIDLSLLSGLVPKVDRASGTLGGQMHATGTFAAPNVEGTVTLHAGDFSISGLPSAVSDVELEVRADTKEIRIAKATAHFAGGDITATGRVPIKGFILGTGEAAVTARGVHLAPAQGVAATLDADLRIALEKTNDGLSRGASGGGKKLPHITGDVLVTAFDYTRPVNLLSDVGGLSVSRKPRAVQSYDPSLDALTLDLRVRSRVPLRIKNNLAELDLDVGQTEGLTVSGTNQRIGLRGELRALPGGHFHLFANEFEIRSANIRFDDPTRIAPIVDVVATTEYRRYTDTSAGAAAGTGTVADTPNAITSSGSGRAGGSSWRITLHAYGDADDLKIDMTSDPALSQDDIFLLLTIGLTRSEVDQVQGSSIGASLAFEAVGTATGADRALKTAIPVIDDFRFGSAYSSRTGRSEPQVTVGKAITKDVRASITTGLTEDEELRSNIEWRLNRQFSILASYDNINDVSSSSIGNVGADFRWRLEFE